MDIRPILSTLRRHKTAAALIVLEVALTCAIVCNALFLVTQRVERISQTSGLAENELVFVRVSGIGKQTNARPAPRRTVRCAPFPGSPPPRRSTSRRSARTPPIPAFR
jgi:hypothetical protein